MAGKKSDLGPTGVNVTHAVRRLREARHLTYAELSRQLADMGREIPPLGLRRIESGERRVDADDLVALAAALNVSPITLLMPETAKRDEVVEVTARKPDTAGAVWDWLRGLFLRGYEDVESLVASNPSWAVQDAMRAASMQRASARIVGGVPRERAHELGEIDLGGMIRGDDQ
jgi:transcriptional regulator with XRE-family HTH domain